MDAEVTVGIVSAGLAVIGVVVAALQLRRTPPSVAASPASDAVQPHVVGDIPREPLFHVRRAEYLADIGEALDSHRACVLIGARGVGKTHLAATYAREFLDRDHTVVVWTVADVASAVITSLADFALQAGVVSEVTDTEPTAKTAVRWLEQTSAEVLLVFDNAVDPDSLAPWLPARGLCKVIITTTDHDFVVLGRAVTIDVFSAGQATEFLCARSDQPGSGDAVLVAQELGMLPLALAQAGAVIRRRKLSFADYYAALQTNSISATLARVPGDGYPHALEEVVLRSIADVESGEDSASVKRCVDLIAVLADSGVRRDLLTTGAASQIEIDGALGALANASIVGFDLTGASVTMHRLTRRVALARLHRDGRAGSAIRAAVELLRRACENGAAHGADIVDHIDAVWASAGDTVERASAEDIAVMLRLWRWGVQHLLELGEPTKAVAVGRRVLHAHEDLLPADHEFTYLARRSLLNVYMVADRGQDAIRLAEQLLAERVRTFGNEDTRTVHARNSLGYCCERAGEIDRALSIHTFNLAESLRVCGLDAQSTLHARINLASALRSSGRMVEAIPMFEENLRENVRVHGAGHNSTVNARGELARAYVQSGRVGDGVALHEQNAVLLKDRADDLDKYWWPQYRAVAYSAAGRHDDAIDLLRGLVELSERTIRHDHPTAIRVRLFHARSVLSAGRTGEAVRLMTAVVEDRQRVLGPDHPASLNARRNLGLALALYGRRRRARVVLNGVVADYERTLGVNHPYTRSAQINRRDVELGKFR